MLKGEWDNVAAVSQRQEIWNFVFGEPESYMTKGLVFSTSALIKVMSNFQNNSYFVAKPFLSRDPRMENNCPVLYSQVIFQSACHIRVTSPVCCNHCLSPYSLLTQVGGLKIGNSDRIMGL